MNIEQNNLSLLNYKFKLSIAPDVEYRVQNVTLPGLTLGSADIQTPFVRLSNPGNIAYDDLQVTFMVGEQMKDYLQIYNWMTSLGYPDGLDQYRDIKADCSVIILNSAMRPIINVRFMDVFPTSLTSIDFDATLPEVQYATATASFRFYRFYYDTI